MTQLSEYDVTFRSIARSAWPFPHLAAKNSTKTHETYMNNTQRTLDLSPRPKLRLAEIDRLIRKHRIIVPPPTRRALAAMCEDGTFETVGSTPTKMGWLVFEDSFLKWVENLDSGS